MYKGQKPSKSKRLVRLLLLELSFAILVIVGIAGGIILIQVFSIRLQDNPLIALATLLGYSIAVATLLTGTGIWRLIKKLLGD